MLDDWPRRQEYLVFGAPQILEAEIAEVADTLRSGWIGTGPKVASFEEAFQRYSGAQQAVAVSSCTAALELALVLIGLEPGDEVLVPAMTFAATANAVVHAGGRPVLVDIDPTTMCLDAERAEPLITPRCRAIIPVHFAGRACDMAAVQNLAARHGLAVIEDCAHAVGATYLGRHVGTLGDMGTFSFYATKAVVTGEGGMLTTGDPALAERARRLSLHGMSADAWHRFTDGPGDDYDVVEPGFKSNMTDIQASLGLHQLSRAEEGLHRRETIWRRYDEAFAELPATTPPPPREGSRHARHLYTLLLDLDRLQVGRRAIRIALHNQGIGTGVHYRAIHLHSFYRNLLGHAPNDFPVANSVSERTLSLPLSVKLSDPDVEDVVVAIRRTLRHFADL